MIEILNRWTKAVVYRADVATVKEAVTKAVAEKADLRGSNLRGSDLSGSDLRGSDLRGSDLSDSDLRGSDLRGSDLRGSDLSGSDLRGSDLRGSDLRGSDLRGSDLRGSDLTPIRDDVWAVLSASPKEVPALRTAIIDGRIDGAQYVGECCCLVGTIAKERGCNYAVIPGLAPDTSRPSERFFMCIRKGDTPDTNPASKIVLDWIDTWLANVRTLIG